MATTTPTLQARGRGLHGPWTTLAAVAVALLAMALPATAQEGHRVTFLVNDATVKDKVLPGVRVLVARNPGEAPVLSGETDLDGRFECHLAPDTYAVTYLLPGYVPVADSPTAVTVDGQVITTTLSMMLEAEGASPGERRVRIILNWGSDPSQVKDVDSHLLCPCGGDTAHVYYGAKEHVGSDHSVDLDVDDTDWGGPETVTLHDPPPGDYSYWVYDYSGTAATLGASEVVVRVLVGDELTAEVRAPADVVTRAWWPFKALSVGADLVPRLVPFADDELAAGLDRVIPPGHENEGTSEGGSEEQGMLPAAIVVLIAIVVVFNVVRRARRRRR
jgi:hypothetical protein